MADQEISRFPYKERGLRHVVEPGLHLVEHALVLPALQAFDLVGRASRLERAG
jgi:hypothetical protein